MTLVHVHIKSFSFNKYHLKMCKVNRFDSSAIMHLELLLRGTKLFIVQEFRWSL